MLVSVVTRFAEKSCKREKKKRRKMRQTGGGGEWGGGGWAPEVSPSHSCLLFAVVRDLYGNDVAAVRTAPGIRLPPARSDSLVW